MIKLSICIPTYNFGEFIGETLDSLLSQITDEIEVIVFDGGSKDNTAEEVSVRRKTCDQLRFHQQEFRGGIDRDIESVVSLARGEYCWLFSADDILLPDSIKKIMDSIGSNYDVYLCEHILCSFEMKPLYEHPPFNDVQADRLFDFGDQSDKITYFQSARTSEAFFSFMTAPIFRKQVWDGADVPESFRGTCWIVAGHLLSNIPTQLTVNYMGEQLLLKRGENDSFASDGSVNRCRIGIESFHHIANTIFGADSMEAFHIRRVLRLDITLKTLLFAKLMAYDNPEQESSSVLERIVSMHYSDPSPSNYFNKILFWIIHPLLLNTVRQLKNSLRA